MTNASMALFMCDDYGYSILGDDEDPDDLKTDYVTLLTELHHGQRTLPLSAETIAYDHRLLLLSKVIFGSNLIEKAGGPLDITRKLVQLLCYHGMWDAVPPTINPHDPVYHVLKDYLTAHSRPSDPPSIIRSYREIVQHIKAACHLMDSFDPRIPITEPLLLSTHRILTQGIPTDQGIPSASYSGLYRQDQVVAGLHAFPPAEQVPAATRKMISSLNHDLQQGDKIDPVALAAKYSHRLVNIHPFLDGNGRMCRLLLNVLLYKLGSSLACFGQTEDEREEYLGIAARASQNMAAQQDDWDDDNDDMAPKYHKELASYTLKYAVESLKGWKHVLDESEKALEEDGNALKGDERALMHVLEAKFRGPNKPSDGSEDLFKALFSASTGVENGLTGI
ncbi:fido domain-containing protein [Triangularia verruculosa]|uniref:Fido domain-containing protein n=1 Tax=Triangularia verruculosa TaxID=2587418 RepID=A0AAN6XL42_9PEZI|nr:fido domain-containing protein [Triangularia verruculosa]